MTDFTRFQTPENVAVSSKEDVPTLFEGISGEEHLKELEATVERLKVLSNERKEPFDDDVIEVPRFCRCLENVLHYQQKEKLTFWSEKKDYYHYLTEGTSGIKSLDMVNKTIQNMTELVTVQGKGRALIRLCLAQQLLADSVQSAIANTKKTKDWYNPSAVLLNTSLSGRFVSSLYDLSTMKFKLPVSGINLDEAWPSFVQKSFTFKGNTDSIVQQKKSGFMQSKHINRDPIFGLERAIEETPSELFVRQQIPFDLDVVSRLFSELRITLTEEFEGYTQESVLPEIKVTKLDDITSGLCLVKDYITAMSEDVTDNSHKSHEVIRELKYQSTETKKQLKESEEKLNVCQLQVKSLLKKLETVEGEKAAIQQKLDDQEQIVSIKAHSELMKVIDGCNKEKETLEEAHSKAEQEITSLVQRLDELNKTNEAIQKRCTEKDEECTTLKETLSLLRIETDRYKEQYKTDQDQRIVELEKVVSDKENELSQVALKLSDAVNMHQMEKTQLEEQLSTIMKRCEACNEEKESVKQELRTVQGLVEQETVSLRFQLSTNDMQLQQAKEDLSGKEKTIVNLKQNVSEQKSELVSVYAERMSQKAKIEELNQQLKISETDYKTSQDELKSISSQLTENTVHRDALREESLKIQSNWDDQKNRMVTDFQKLSQQESVLSEENEHLRKALQKLLEQKVSLWKHADELEQEQVAKGIWIDSKLVPNCMECSIIFGVFTRKHHCRSCGKVFCTNCCINKVQLPSNRDKARVCNACFNHITSLRTPLAAELVNTLDKEDIHQQSNSNISSSDDQPINAFPGGVSLYDNNNLMHLSPLNDSDESLLQHVKDLITTPRNTSKRASLDYSTEYSVNPLISSPVTTKSFGIPNSDNSSINPDDEFCVIDFKSSDNPVITSATVNDSTLDVNTLRSKLATLESSNQFSPSVSHKIGKRSSPMDNDLQEVDDLEIAGGGMKQVMVEVNTPRTVISWQFSSQPRGIAMGLNYMENENAHVQSILPEKRVMSHKTILVGEYVAQKAGVYTLVFNNSHSKYSGRLLTYKVWKNCQL